MTLNGISERSEMYYSHRGKRYRVKGHRNAGLISLLKWQFGGGRSVWPKLVDNLEYPPPPLHVYGKSLQATWIGHSTVLIQTAGINILTDPFFSMRASPVGVAGPKRVRKPALMPHQLPPIDIVLISHNHYDHLDRPGLRRLLKDHSPTFVTPLGNRKYLRSLRIGLDIVELDWRGGLSIGPLSITAMPALHWSKRGIDDANRALWASFVIEAPGGPIYFAGDTGYGDGKIFRAVKSKFGSPRLSLLPIGAYEPRWFMKSQHMNPDDAVLAHVDLGSRTSFAIHHGTIQLTNEAIDQPVLDLQIALAKHDVSEDAFVVPDVGQGIFVS